MTITATNNVDGYAARRRAVALMFASSLAISFTGVIVRNIEHADSWQINFYRALASVMVVMILLLINYRSDTIAQVRQIGLPGVLAGAIVALAAIAFVQALVYTTIANTVFTLCAIPFITTLLAFIFLRERVSRVTIVAMLFAAFGVALMMVDGLTAGTSYGNAMALLAATCFAGFAVIVRGNRQVDMFPAFLVSGAIILLASFVAAKGNLEIPLRDILLCLFWGGVLSGFANWVFVVAARHLMAGELTLFMLLEYALGPVWVWLLIGEAPLLLALAGGLIVVLSVTIRTLIEHRRPSPGRGASNTSTE